MYFYNSLDLIPPDLVCPSTISRTIPALQQCLTVFWEIPFSADNSGVDPFVTSDPASGSCLDPGTTVVFVIATDVSGNSATCQFSVLVDVVGETISPQFTSYLSLTLRPIA